MHIMLSRGGHATPMLLSMLALLSQTPQAAFTGTGAVTLSTGTRTIADSTITASAQDQSAVYVTGGTLTLKSDRITSTGYVSSSASSSKPGSGAPSESGTDSASFYGLAAGILAWSTGSSAVINIANTHVATSGIGANGVFAYGKGVVSISGDSVICEKNYSHAIMCSGGGTLSASNIYLKTSGTNSGAVATDRNGGTITLDSGIVITEGSDSPGIYSTGTITVTNSDVTSATEAASIEGSNSITLRNTKLAGSSGKKSRGIFIYQSMSGDATGSHSTFSMSGGSYTWNSSSGPAIFVSNDTGAINLTNVTVTNNSPMLALSSSVAYSTGEKWGDTTKKTNGGKMRLTADSGTSLSGSVIVDSISDAFLVLRHGSSLSGSIDSAAKGALVTLHIDSTSSWSVTALSHLDTLNDPLIDVSNRSVANIVGNGHNVVYSKAANASLNGRVYALAGSGCLVPEDSVSATCSGNPTAGLAARTTANGFATFRVSSGWERISFVGTSLAGKTKTLALLDLRGRRLATRETSLDAVSIPELFGVPTGALHIVKVLSVR